MKRLCQYQLCKKPLPDESLDAFCSRICRDQESLRKNVEWYAQSETDILHMWPFFTPREQEVMVYRRKGWTYGRVAKALGLSEQAIYTYERNAKKRLIKFRRTPRPGPGLVARKAGGRREPQPQVA